MFEHVFVFEVDRLIIDTLLQSRNLTLNMGDFNNKWPYIHKW